MNKRSSIKRTSSLRTNLSARDRPQIPRGCSRCSKPGPIARLAGGMTLALISCVLIGCATAPRVPSVRTSPLPTIPLDVVFQPGDVVEIKFQFTPDFNEVQTIRPDGKISLALLQEVEAADKSPEQLRKMLLEAYSDKLKNPEIMVIARVEENRLVHVGGEVELTRNTDGLVAIPIVGRLTIWEAIMRAGGILNRSAKISNVLVIRRIGETQYARTIDLRAEFRNPETEAFFLQANDIVYVPRTKIDRIDQWVDQYLSDIIPNWLSVSIN